MVQVRRLALAAVAALAIVSVAACSSDSKSSSSSSSSTSSGSSSSSAGGGLTVPTSSGGTTVNVVLSDTNGTAGPMTMTVSPASTAHGDITFTAKNTGTIDHEMVVLKIDTAFDQLPVGTDEPDKVDEATSKGELGDPELKPGETRSVTLSGLEAGKYVLVCNIAKHYGLGMRAAFTLS